jgi:hypothetical protein
MRHIAVQAMSLYSPRPFTATGLGDRIHWATIAWTLAPATLHLTRAQVTGGQFGNKPESWAEIVALFPAGSVAVQAHPITPSSEAEWLAYCGAERFDYAGMKRIPLLTAEPQGVDLPARFYTAQWDANGPSRAVAKPPKFDLPTVVVGGQAEGPLRWSLKTVGYAMSRAEGHVGVDSAFFHLAQLYMPPERIRIHHNGSMSHHVLRARDNGAVCVRM